MNKLKNVFVTGLLMLFCMLSSGTIVAGKIYKSIDGNGRVVYSTTPPANAVEEKVVNIAPAPDKKRVEATRSRNEKIINSARGVSDRLDKKKSAKIGKAKLQAERLEKAEKDLEKAKAAFMEGSKQLGSDRSGKKLRAAYFQRVKTLEAGVVKAEKAVADARRGK